VIEFIVVMFSMESVTEQRICVKFCFTHNTLHEAYGDDAASQTVTSESFKLLKIELQWMANGLADHQHQGLTCDCPG
jgi:hypothetical protein